MLDPETAPVADLNRELARLQRQYRVASHEVGETVAVTRPVEQVELRKTRLRKPPH